MHLKDENNMKESKITLLSEAVAEKDLFKHSSHTKIADTIYQIIESENNAITIGLEGDWGSGKSTVINLLEKKIDDNNQNKKDGKTLFFKFDAWSHDGDPLRTTYLTSLIEQINSHLSPECGHKESLEEISLRVKSKTKTIRNNTTKSSTKFGKFLALAVMMVPIGTALFNKSFDYEKTTVIPWELISHLFELRFDLMLADIKSISILTSIATLFLLAPLIFIASWAILKKCDNKERLCSVSSSERKTTDNNDYKNKKDDKWEFISSNTEETIVQDITETGDRTSIEFEQLFNQIVGLTIGRDKIFNKAICVIDNIDRVSTEHAKSIWSTLQIFISKRDENVKSVWFLIPFDEQAFKKIWHESQPESTDEDTAPYSFTEKCFQLIIDVPTPITSNWIEYLSDISKQAFEKWKKPELSDSFVIQYKDIYSNTNHSPTPRGIKNLINQVQALYIQFGEEEKISIQAITIYAILRKTKSKKEIKEMILYKDNEETTSLLINRVQCYKQELASILFHTPYETGYELLLKDELEKIIVSPHESERENIAQLYKVHNQAFWQAWSSYFSSTDYFDPLEQRDNSLLLIELASKYLTPYIYDTPLSIYINKVHHSFYQIIYEYLYKNNFYKAHLYISYMNNLRKIESSMIDKITGDLSFLIGSDILPLNEPYSQSRNASNILLNVESIKKIVDCLRIQHIPCDNIRDEHHYFNWIHILSIAGITIPEVTPSESTIEAVVKKTLDKSSLDALDINRICTMVIKNPSWNGWTKVTTLINRWINRPLENSISSYNYNASYRRPIDKYSTIYMIIYILRTRSENHDIIAEIDSLADSKEFSDSLYYEFKENPKNIWLGLLLTNHVKIASGNTCIPDAMVQQIDQIASNENAIDLMINEFVTGNKKS